MNNFNFSPSNLNRVTTEPNDISLPIESEKSTKNLEEVTTPTKEQLQLIQDAFHRVYPNLDKKTLETEMAYVLQEFQVNKRGHINWRSMNIGRKLFAALSEAQNHRCCYCHKELQGYKTKNGIVENTYGTIEHVIKKSDGGSDHPRSTWRLFSGRSAASITAPTPYWSLFSSPGPSSSCAPRSRSCSSTRRSAIFRS